MKKRFMAFFCILLLILTLPPLTSTAEDGWEEDGFGYADGFGYYLNETENAVVLAYTGEDAFVEIPSVLNGRRVTAIGSGAFAYNNIVRSVVIAEGITTVEYAAFLSCENLASISLPDTLETLSEGAFLGCEVLTDIRLSENNYFLAVRDGVLFDRLSSTLLFYPAARTDTSYTVPADVRIIGIGAFVGAHSLTEVTLPDSVIGINALAFGDCAGLTSFSFSANLGTVMPAAFMGCTNLASFTVAEGNRSLALHDGALIDTLNGILLSYPAGRTATTYTLPESVNEIAMGAFYGCAALATFDIPLPSCLQVIGISAFANCTALRSFTVPPLVFAIGDAVFDGCTALTEILVAKGNKDFYATDGVLFESATKTLLCYPAGRTGESYSIPEGTYTIGSGAFSACGALRSVTIPRTVSEIAETAFNGCPALERVDIPAQTAVIPSFAFVDCPALTISGKRGSTAEVYAAEYDIPFVSTGNAPGNVNGDDAVDTADAVLVLQRAAKLIGNDRLDAAVADVNGDGTIDTADAVLILQYAAGLIDRFPAA